MKNGYINEIPKPEHESNKILPGHKVTSETPNKEHGLDLINQTDSPENDIRFAVQIHNFPGDVIDKSIISKIEAHIKTKEFNTYGVKTILIKRINNSSIIKYLTNIGSLFIISGKIICISDEFIFELMFSTRSTYIALHFGIFTTSIEVFENTKKLLVETFKDIIKDVISCGIRWFYTNYQGAIREDYISEVLDDIIFQESYPFIENLNKYIAQYESSDEKVLIMMGPPGTGKTRLVRQILRQIGKVYTDETGETDEDFSLYYTTDSRVLEKDEMFISYITSIDRIMVLEDIDFSLRSRTDGNKEMYRLLATSDGLFQNMNKKIIISTNVMGEEEIDSALIRPGRCFDIIEFRALTTKEGNSFLEAVGSKQKVTRSHTLAELYKIYNSDKNILSRNVPKRRTSGFQ